MSDQRFRVIDFETTGLPPDASVCEAAYTDMWGDPPTARHKWARCVYPTTPMELAARATHHITDEEIEKEGVSWDRAQYMLTKFWETDEEVFYVAHNADFEKAFFNPEGSVWIDTYKVALRLWPDAPSHSNQMLRYFLDLKLDRRATPPHRAGPDTWVTAHILERALEAATAEEMIAWSAEPAYLTKISFGKHRGKLFSEVPADYLQWILRQSDMDEAVTAAAQRALDEQNPTGQTDELPMAEAR